MQASSGAAVNNVFVIPPLPVAPYLHEPSFEARDCTGWERRSNWPGIADGLAIGWDDAAACVGVAMVAIEWVRSVHCRVEWHERLTARTNQSGGKTMSRIPFWVKASCAATDSVGKITPCEQLTTVVTAIGTVTALPEPEPEPLQQPQPSRSPELRNAAKGNNSSRFSRVAGVPMDCGKDGARMMSTKTPRQGWLQASAALAVVLLCAGVTRLHYGYSSGPAPVRSEVTLAATDSSTTPVPEKVSNNIEASSSSFFASTSPFPQSTAGPTVVTPQQQPRPSAREGLLADDSLSRLGPGARKPGSRTTTQVQTGHRSFQPHSSPTNAGRVAEEDVREPWVVDSAPTDAGDCPVTASQANQTSGWVEVKCMPSFVLIGPGRTGTRELLNWLNVHPDLQSPHNEQGLLRRINSTLSLKNGQRPAWVEYQSHFPTVAVRAPLLQQPRPRVVTFEKTPGYIRMRMDQLLAVRRMFPSMRFIAQLRAPIEMTYSSFLTRCSPASTWRAVAAGTQVRRVFLVARLLEGPRAGLLKLIRAVADVPTVAYTQQPCTPLVFDQFVNETMSMRRMDGVATAGIRPSADPEFLRLVNSSVSLVDDFRRWFSVFPREQMLVVCSHDLFKDPPKQLSRITSFVGVRPFDFGRAMKKTALGTWTLAREGVRSKADDETRKTRVPMSAASRAVLTAHAAQYQSALFDVLDWSAECVPRRQARQRRGQRLRAGSQGASVRG